MCVSDHLSLAYVFFRSLLLLPRLGRRLEFVVAAGLDDRAVAPVAEAGLELFVAEGLKLGDNVRF
jgi:hypothetical protein